MMILFDSGLIMTVLVLKQHASRFMLIFTIFFLIYLKVKFCELNIETTHYNNTCNPHKSIALNALVKQ
jgi:hypothetical protein